jgi:PAS domain S-box-containing protein
MKHEPREPGWLGRPRKVAGLLGLAWVLVLLASFTWHEARDRERTGSSLLAADQARHDLEHLLESLTIYAGLGTLGLVALMGAVRASELQIEVFEEALRQSKVNETRYRTLVETSLHPILILDAQGRVVEVNQETLRLNGSVEAGRLLGTHATQWVAPSSQSRFLEYWETLQKTHRVVGGELELLRADGTSLLAEVNGSILPGDDADSFLVVVILKDVTEARHYLQALEASERQYREMCLEANKQKASLEALIRHSPSAIVVADEDRKVLVWNPGAERIFGWTEAEVLGAPLPYVPGKSEERHQAQWHQAQFHRSLDEPAAAIEVQRRRKDGGIVNLLLATSPIPVAAGEKKRVVGMLTDISELKRLRDLDEARLRLNELAKRVSLNELLRAMVQEAQAITDSRFGYLRVLGADQSFSELRVWSEAGLRLNKETVSIPPSAVETGNWLEAVRRREPVIQNEAQTNGAATGDSLVLRELVAPVLREGVVVAVAGVGNRPANYTPKDVEMVEDFWRVAWDVVSQKQIEEQLRESEERLRVLFDSVTDLVYLKDTQLRYTHVNPAFARFLGRTREEIIGRTRAEVLGPEQDPLSVEAEQKVLEGLTEQQEYSLAVGGQRRTLETVRSPIRDASGRITGLCGVSRDVTHRKLAEDALHETHERLRLTLEAASMGCWDWDVRRNRVEYGGLFESILGMPAEALGTNPWTYWMRLEPGDRTRAKRRVVRQLRTSDVFDVEYRIRRIDNSYTWVLSRGQAYRNASGSIVRILGTSQNVTDRKEVENKLLLANSLLASTLECTGDGLLVVDQSGAVLTCNQKFYQMWKIPAGRRLPDATLLFEQTPSQYRDYDRFAARWSQLRKATDLIATDYVEFSDQRVFERYTQPLRMGAEIKGRVFSFRDITPRYRAETALRASETRLRMTLDAAAIGTWDLDVGSGRLVTGGHYYDLLNASRELNAETLANLLDAIHPDDRETARAAIDAAIPGREPFCLEFRVRDAVPPRWLRTQGRALALEEGDPSRVLGVLWEVTERRLAQQALAESREMLRSVLDNVPVGVFWKDRASVYLGCNRHFAELNGAGSPEEIIGLKDGDLAPLEESLRYRAEDQRVIAAGETWLNTEQFSVDRGGNRRWIRTSKVPLRDAHGQIIGVLGIDEDFTHRKSSEEALRASLNEKDAMLKEIHHRVKNNLQLVSSLLRLRSNQLRNEEGRAALQDTQARIRSMALLHESLYRSGNFARVNLAGYVNTLAAHLIRATPAASERVEVHCQVAEVSVSLDVAVPCGLIINELLLNGLKHGFPNERRGRIQLEVKGLGPDQVCLRVEDNGVGLPPGLDLAQTQSLGLQLVGDLVTQLGGTLAMGSNPGAFFEIRFPLRLAGSQKGNW